MTELIQPSICTNKEHTKLININFCDTCDIGKLHDVKNEYDILKPQQIRYEPIEYEHAKKQMILIIKELLNITEISSTIANKKKYAYIIFEWLAKNLWFLEKHERFRITCQLKLEEFENDPNGKEICDRFRWIRSLQPPFGNISTYGRKIKPVF